MFGLSLKVTWVDVFVYKTVTIGRTKTDYFLRLLQDDGSVTTVAEATAVALTKCYELPPYCRPPPPPPSPSPPSPPPPSPSPPPSPYYHYGSQGSGYGKSGSGYAYNNNAYTEEVSANLN